MIQKIRNGWQSMLKSSKTFLVIGICMQLAITVPIITFLIYAAIPLRSPQSGFDWTPETNFAGFYSIAGHEVLMPQDRDMRILMLSDLHLAFIWNGRTLRHITRLVNEADPDLIVLMGDSFGHLLNDVGARQLINHMDNFEIPWAPILGNHDQRGKATRDRIAHMLGNTNFGLFLYGPNSLREFSGNYFINLVRPRTGGTEIVHSLYMLGSGTNRLGSERYPNPPQGQIDWYDWAVRGNREMHRISDARSSIMVHTPFREFDSAWYRGDVLFGDRNEPTRSPESTAEFFERVVYLDCTVNIFAGHNHDDYFSAMYRGIQMTNVLNGGRPWLFQSLPRMLRTDAPRGGTLLTVNPQTGATDVRHIFTNRSE